MSHVATVDVEVVDLDALEMGAAKLGLKLIRNQKTYKWYGRFMNDYHGDDAAYKHGLKPEEYGTCDHAIVVPGASVGTYEIGVRKNPDGPGYKLVWDWFAGGNGLCQHISHNPNKRDAGKLLQAYAVSAIKRKAGMTRGHRFVSELPLADGSIKVRVEVSA